MSDNFQKKEPAVWSLKQYFGAFLLFRLFCIFLNQTWFVPDEYWQSQEVAHHLAFGYLTIILLIILKF